MKKIILLLSIILLTIVSACSKEEAITPNERFDTYVKLWQKHDFAKMYGMLTEEATNQYPTEQYVDRYTKLYEDLHITDIKITYKALADEKLETVLEEGTAIIPFHVEMESIAGPITFDYEAKLVQIGEEEDKNWFVEWDPGFIFPEIKDGGEISFQSISPSRGEILDRNRIPLALNDQVWEIGIVPEKLGANPEQSKAKIAQLLQISVDRIDKELGAGWVKPDLFVPLKKVPKTNETILNQLWEIEGIQGNNVIARVYPLGEAAAHLIGYVAPITAEDLEKVDQSKYTANDVIGKRGLEQLFEERLKGERGLKIIVKKEGADSIVLAEKPVQDGENIMLTIDSYTQETIFNSFGEESGTAAAIHPKTGETLALVSSPAFDPNDFQFGISQSKLDELENNPLTPLINRFAATYAPGSAIKPITAAIGLQNGSIIPGEGIEINGLTWGNGTGWGDYEVRRVSTSNGPVDVNDALVRSDNIYFAMKAVEMGSKALITGFNQFGLGEKLPYEYPIAMSTISSDGELNGEVLLANTSYGQGEIEFSSLHMALAYTPFLNDGNLLKPTLLQEEETGQVWHEGIISKEHVDLIKQALRDVVTKGTGKKAQEADFPISGKTGTAELKLSIDDKDGEENGWFVGYPTDDQDILIALMLENVKHKGTSGLAAERVTDILKQLK